jgi:hypothetical protein
VKLPFIANKTTTKFNPIVAGHFGSNNKNVGHAVPFSSAHDIRFLPKRTAHETTNPVAHPDGKT